MAFPEIWTSIRARYQEHKKAMTAERHRVLETEVWQIVAELHEAGIAPSQKLVRSKLKRSPLRFLACISDAISKALTALSTGSAR